MHARDRFLLCFLLSLPKAVKRRINALKQLQVKCAHIEAKFYEEVHDLERKYAALYQPLFDKVGASPGARVSDREAERPHCPVNGPVLLFTAQTGA